MILLGILLLNFVLGIVLKSMQETGGSIDPITFIFALVAGFALQETFPYALYNGVSRKSFFSASIFAVVVTTIAWTALTVILTLLSRAFAANIILYDTIYQSGVFAMAIWYFAAILCLIASGWFFTVLASVLTKRAKLILIGGTVVAGSAFDSTGSCDRRRYFDVAEVRIPVFRCLEQFGQSISFRRDVLFVILCAAFLYMGNHPAQRA